ncbi:MAG TPA: P1 family peptidase [Anaerolineales bacterium]|nr:P1 family peptidase [Anaerolineales bacterium]
MSKPRARDLGIPFEGSTGPLNAITDLPAVEVGFTTVIEGTSARTGVTIIHPRGRHDHDPVFAGWFPFNGNGEMTGSAWIEEGGFLEGPIGITNTHSVGLVRDTIIDWQARHEAIFQRWSCPVVAETADGWLNEMNGFHLKPEHVWQALDSASGGVVEEGNVGGGTGMIAYEYKGGTGTSSRRLHPDDGGWTVAALVQANFGRRFQLTVAGVPVGRHLKEDAPFSKGASPFERETGSLIVVLGTDAPLLPHQLRRLAKRASLGMARTGSMGGNGSGDIFLAFSTANRDAATASLGAAAASASGVARIDALANSHLDPVLYAAVLATEEAIINAIVAAETMTGRDNLTIKSLPHAQLQVIMKQYGR